MRLLLFVLVALSLNSCASSTETVVEQLFPVDVTPQASVTLALIDPSITVEAIVDKDTFVLVEQRLYQTPCSVLMARIDGADGTGAKPYHYSECQNLPGPWVAGYVWVLVDKQVTKEWVRCPALLKPYTTDKVVVHKIKVLTDPSGYASDLLVQAN